MRQWFVFVPGLGQMGANPMNHHVEPGTCEPGLISQMLTKVEDNHNECHTALEGYCPFSISFFFETTYSKLFQIHILCSDIMRNY